MGLIYCYGNSLLFGFFYKAEKERIVI